MSETTIAALGRRRTIAVWVLTVVTAALFAIGGIFKVSGSEQVIQGFSGYGFPPWFAVLVGIGELGGAVVLLLPPVAFLGGLGLMGIAAGAFLTHLVTGDAIGMTVPSVVYFVLAAVVTWLRGRDFARTATRLFG